MDYAINKITGTLELATRASRYGQFKCPVCKKGVTLRRGKIKTPYFAHLPGNGTFECENFVLGHYTLAAKENISIPVKRRMELRLVISTERKLRGWSLELALPTCNLCRAKITLDVGGRNQTLDMSGMVKRRQIGAELSIQPYRIISFSGDPDPAFISEVEKECQGLPSSGGAVFTAVGSGASGGFPLAQELRCSDTYAFLWQQPVQPDFPNELVIERLVDKQGWHLALVTIPEIPTSECAQWLHFFTHLQIIPARSSITAIWPFLTKNTSVNQIECLQSNTILLSANMVSSTSQGVGPTIYAQGASSILSAIGIEEAPAFFTLDPGNSELVGISDASNQDVKVFLSFSSNVECISKFPSVDFVFTKKEGGQEIVSLHERRCVSVTTELRLLGSALEYISMPFGAEGFAKIESLTGSSNIKLLSSDNIAPHDNSMCLLQPDSLSKLAICFLDPACQLEIEFGGLGELYLSALSELSLTAGASNKLSSDLRSRLFSFLFQMRLITPNLVLNRDDLSLVETLKGLQPETHLLPHYRLLVKEVITSGFEFNRLR